MKANVKHELNKNIKKMSEMLPLEVGIITSDIIRSYVGRFVMRTQSTEHFEVMDLSDMSSDCNWSMRKNQSIRLDTIMVQILPKGTVVEIIV